MLVVEVLVVLAVLFGGVLAATGRGGGMEPAPPDEPDRSLPGGRLEPVDVHRLRFPLAFRGYRMAEVDSALDVLADALAGRDQEIAELRARLAPGSGTAAGDPEDRTAGSPEG